MLTKVSCAAVSAVPSLLCAASFTSVGTSVTVVFSSLDTDASVTVCSSGWTFVVTSSLLVIVSAFSTIVLTSVLGVSSTVVCSTVGVSS